MSHAPHTPGSEAEGFNREEPPVRWIGLFLVGLFLFVAASGFGVSVYFGNAITREEHVKRGEIPNVQWDALRGAADKQLGSYGWIDDKTVHIPINKAIELTVQELNKDSATKK